MNHKQWDRQTGQASDPGLESIRSAWRELDQDEPPQLLDQAVLPLLMIASSGVGRLAPCKYR